VRKERERNVNEKANKVDRKTACYKNNVEVACIRVALTHLDEISKFVAVQWAMTVDRAFRVSNL
jgi:hypothetical protein